MFRAHLPLRHSLAELNPGQRHDLCAATTDTVHAVIDKGGRDNETDLFCKPGGYVRLMDSAGRRQALSRLWTDGGENPILGRGVLFLPEMPDLNNKRIKKGRHLPAHF